MKVKALPRTKESILGYDTSGRTFQIRLHSWDIMWADILDQFKCSGDWALCMTIGLAVIYIESK